MPLGLLGVAHVCRFRAPVLTAIATPLVVWGMWGFGNVLAMGYVAGTVAPVGPLRRPGGARSTTA